jgi:hypothetical protein
MTDDGSWLKAHGRAHKQEVTVARTGVPPYGIRDEDPASQAANFSATHGSLEGPGRESGPLGLAQTEHRRQVEKRG